MNKESLTDKETLNKLSEPLQDLSQEQKELLIKRFKQILEKQQELRSKLSQEIIDKIKLLTEEQKELLLVVIDSCIQQNQAQITKAFKVY